MRLQYFYYRKIQTNIYLLFRITNILLVIMNHLTYNWREAEENVLFVWLEIKARRMIYKVTRFKSSCFKNQV